MIGDTKVVQIGALMWLEVVRRSNGLKMGSIPPFVHPKWSKIIFDTTPFLSHFWSKMAHFERFFRP